MSRTFVHETAVIDEGAQIGEGTKIWHFSHVMKTAKIGKDCVIGQNCYIDSDVIIGNNVHLQNNVSVYKLVTLEDDVFVGPSVVFTNDLLPPSDGKAWLPTLIKKGTSIGANATIVCGVTLGEGCMIGAGAVVTENVPAGMVYKGVPARIYAPVQEVREKFVKEHKIDKWW
jgi:UDP-2-acetamido-3-amino-2,3-dideoxy-glucuronate N-acetyltransferase